MCGLKPAGARLGRNDPVRTKRFGYAFELLQAEVLKVEGRRCQAPCRFRYDDGVRSGLGLQTRGDIRRLPHRIHRPWGAAVADFAHDHRTGAYADARSQGDRADDVHDGRKNLERGMNGTNGVVLVCARPAEKRHDAVAEIAGDLAVVAPDGRAARSPIRVNELLEVFGIELLRQLRGPHQVTEHHRDLAEFGFPVSHGNTHSRSGCPPACLVCGLQRFDGPEQSFAVTE